MRTAVLTLDDHMLYTIFIDALPAEYEWEARNLASCDSIDRDDIIKAVRERHHRLSGNRKKGSNAGYAGHAMFVVVGGGGGGGGRGTEKVDLGESTDEAVKAPTRSVVARLRLPVAMAAEPTPPKVVPPR